MQFIKLIDYIHRKRLPLIIGSIFIFLVISSSYFLFPFLFTGNSKWNGYYTLLIDNSISLSEIGKIMESGEFDGFFSADNTIVSFPNFAGIDKVSVSELDSRLDELDPRMDPFLKEIGNYFHTENLKEEWHIIYIKSRLPLMLQYFSIQSLFNSSGISWKLVNFNLYQKIYFILLFTGFVLGFTFYASFERIYLFVGSLPWFLFIMNSNFSFFIAGSLIYIAWSFMTIQLLPVLRFRLNHGKWEIPNKKIILVLLVTVSALFLSILVLAAEDRKGYYFFLLLLGIIAELSVTILLIAKNTGKIKKQLHPLFFPVSILKKQDKYGWKKENFLQLLVCFLILIVPAALIIPDFRLSVKIPTPVKYNDIKDFSWNSLEDLSLHKENGLMPDLSDFLIHTAYHEGFAYGRDYLFPERNEKIYINTFKKNGNGIFSSQRVVKEFTDIWYGSIIRSYTDCGLIEMLLEQPAAVGVQAVFPEKALTPYFIVLYYLLSFFITVPIFFHDIGLRVQSQNDIIRLILRRKQQTA